MKIYANFKKMKGLIGVKELYMYLKNQWNPMK